MVCLESFWRLLLAYKSVMSCVRIEHRLTEFFDCPVGLSQAYWVPYCFLYSLMTFRHSLNNGVCMVFSFCQDRWKSFFCYLRMMFWYLILLWVFKTNLMYWAQPARNFILGTNIDKQKCWYSEREAFGAVTNWSCQWIHLFGVYIHYENERFSSERKTCLCLMCQICLQTKRDVQKLIL